MDGRGPKLVAQGARVLFLAARGPAHHPTGNLAPCGLGSALLCWIETYMLGKEARHRHSGKELRKPGAGAPASCRGAIRLHYSVPFSPTSSTKMEGVFCSQPQKKACHFLNSWETQEQGHGLMNIGPQS